MIRKVRRRQPRDEEEKAFICEGDTPKSEMPGEGQHCYNPHHTLNVTIDRNSASTRGPREPGKNPKVSRTNGARQLPGRQTSSQPHTPGPAVGLPGINTSLPRKLLVGVRLTSRALCKQRGNLYFTERHPRHSLNNTRHVHTSPAAVCVPKRGCVNTNSPTVNLRLDTLQWTGQDARNTDQHQTRRGHGVSCVCV